MKFFPRRKFLTLGSLFFTVLLLTSSHPTARSLQTSSDSLLTLVNGKMFEVGKKEASGRYEFFKYEGYRSEGCTIEWKETHGIFENSKPTLSTFQTVTVELEYIDIASLTKSKYETGQVVSFTTKQLQPRIKSLSKTSYGGLPEESATGFGSGAGFYLASESEATKLFDELKRRIRGCNKS